MVRPSTVESFPLRWEYEVQDDFSQDDVAASWVTENPKTWGQKSIPLLWDVLFLTAPSAPMGCILLLPCWVHSIPGMTVKHLEWHRSQSARAYYLLLASTKRGSKHNLGQTFVWELTEGCDRQGSEPDLVIQGTSFAFGSKSFSFSGANLLVSPPRTQVENTHVIEVWDSFMHTRSMRLDAHTEHIAWAGYSPDDRMIASASWNQTVKLWDANNDRSLLERLVL